jgi:hypothetical protein
MIANMTNQKTYPGTSGSNVLMKPSVRCVCSSCFGVVCSTDGLLAGLQPEAQVRSFILKKAPRIPAGLEKEEWSNSASYEKTHKSETYKSQEGRCGCCMASTELTGLGPRCGRVYGSGDSMRKVSDYRKHAEECRKLMRGAKTPEHREMLHQMAETWESLAESREKQLQRRANSKLLRDKRKGVESLVWSTPAGYAGTYSGSS